MAVYDVLRFFLRGLNDSKFTLMASAMAYQFFFSFFPTLLLVFMVIPYFPMEGLEEQILTFLQQFVPADAFLFIEQIVNDYFEGSSSAFRVNIWSLSITFGIAMYGALRGIIAMMKAFTKNEEVFKSRNIFEMYGVALMIFMMLAAVILSAVTLLILLDGAISLMIDYTWITSGFGTVIHGAIEYLITLLTIFFSISILYYFVPPTHERWKFISPGGVMAGFLTSLAMVGLRIYLANISIGIYGSVGTIILLMIWFYYISLMLLIGFELNAAIDLAQHHKKPEDQVESPSPDEMEVASIDSPLPPSQKESRTGQPLSGNT
ncbi:YihY/virulence factor BrkB family protein [Pontibacter sp. G13]|uniref:YihY/virulence factor BrkB family protein n=1 Tax=Pontibacter sp. G13 TaxID=3074898 RepID=UPI00288935A5|nr:YihY/virulence factor BrkB family protein [Pontibacter sp. G13]WNJ18822.1 YihY/virulence factor BrkB family protein [Pontibacter sp. G13]